MPHQRQTGDICQGRYVHLPEGRIMCLTCKEEYKHVERPAPKLPPMASPETIDATVRRNQGLPEVAPGPYQGMKLEATMSGIAEVASKNNPNPSAIPEAQPVPGFKPPEPATAGALPQEMANMLQGAAKAGEESKPQGKKK